MGLSLSAVTRYSIELREIIFVKGDGFLSFAKNMGKIQART